MKSKILKFIILIVINTPILCYSQYTETFGNPITSSVLVTSYTGYSATGILYSGGYYGLGAACVYDPTPTINKNNQSLAFSGATTCTLSSSSRQGYLVLGYSDICAFDFTIRNINTLNYSNLGLSLNGRRSSSSGTNPYLMSLLIQYSTNSTDGINGTWTNYNAISFTTTWTAYSLPQPLPSSANLSLRFKYNNPTCPSGNCTFSLISIDDIKITGTLGLTDNLINEKISIYPNPANDKFTIDFGNDTITNYTIKINNMLGQEVYTNFVDKPQFEVTKTWQGQGIYFVKVYNENKNLVGTKKIMLQ